MQSTLLEAIKKGSLVADGATGTQLYERGVFINRSLEEACLSSPAMVRAIHAEYVAAGAQLIETHTFAANHLKLARHGLGQRFEMINRTAVDLALEAADGRAYVAGAMGPTGTTPGVISDSELDGVSRAFEAQAALLAKAGVDAIILETFRLLSEMRIAIRAVRNVCKLPIIAQIAFDSDGKTSDGADPLQVVRILKEAGADVIGANCVEGPKGIYAVVEQMVGHGVPISAQPNAGYPRRRDDRMIYMATPEYFGVYARRFFKLGVSMVGGCCGTRAEHIQSISGAARMMGGSGPPLPASVVSRVSEPREIGLTPCPTALKTGLSKKVTDVYERRVKGAEPVAVSPDSFVVSVEINPPSGLDISGAVVAAQVLRGAKIDAINVADGPRATVRMSNQTFAHLIQDQVGIEVLLHVCCRDRNLLGLHSDLLASHVLGIDNLVIITGDPPKMGDYPQATAVFDLDSVELLRLTAGLNRGLDPAGKPMKLATNFYCACGAEPAALDYDRELRRLEDKREAGAELIMTQPVYDPEVLRRFLDDTKHLDMPVLIGLLPLASFRNAEFLHNEVPGMQIPGHIRERMREADGAAARAEGVKIAQEALAAVIDDVVGAYIMPPFGRYRAALEILEPFGYAVAADPSEIP